MFVKPDYSKGPLPDVRRRLARFFWDGTSKGELRFPRCRSCGRFHFYPQVLCRYCQSKNIEWTTVSGRGEVISWIILRHAFIPEFEDRLPLIVILVEFKDAPGIRLISNLIQCSPEQVYFKMPVEVVFHKVNEDVTLPLFKPIQGKSYL